MKASISTLAVVGCFLIASMAFPGLFIVPGVRAAYGSNYSLDHRTDLRSRRVSPLHIGTSGYNPHSRPVTEAEIRRGSEPGYHSRRVESWEIGRRDPYDIRSRRVEPRELLSHYTDVRSRPVSPLEENAWHDLRSRPVTQDEILNGGNPGYHSRPVESGEIGARDPYDMRSRRVEPSELLSHYTDVHSRPVSRLEENAWHDLRSRPVTQDEILNGSRPGYYSRRVRASDQWTLHYFNNRSRPLRPSEILSY